MKEVRDTLGRMEPLLVRLEELSSHMASKADLNPIVDRLGKLEGAVAALPTSWRIASIVGAIVVLAFTVARFVLPLLPVVK